MKRGGAGNGLAAAIAVTVLIAGCGSSTLSPSDLRTQASAICRTATARLNAIPSPAAPAGAVTFLNRGIAVLHPEFEQLRKLSSTGTTEVQLRTAVQAFDLKLAHLRVAVRDIDRGADPADTMHTLQGELVPIVTAENARWQALGIPACLSH